MTSFMHKNFFLIMLAIGLIGMMLGPGSGAYGTSFVYASLAFVSVASIVAYPKLDGKIVGVACLAYFLAGVYVYWP